MVIGNVKREYPSTALIFEKRSAHFVSQYSKRLLKPHKPERPNRSGNYPRLYDESQTGAKRVHRHYCERAHQAMQKDEKRIAIFSIALQQVSAQTVEGPFKQLLQAHLDHRNLSFVSACCHFLLPISEMNSFAKQGLHFSCPSQTRTLFHQTLQVPDLMRQTDLMGFGRCVQLRLPAIAYPNFRFALAHEILDHIISATWHYQMILALSPTKTHCHQFLPCTRALVSSLPITLLWRTCSPIASASALRRFACLFMIDTAPPALKAKPNNSSQIFNNRL